MLSNKQLDYARSLRSEHPDAPAARRLLMDRYNNLIDTDNYESADWLGEIDGAVFVVVLDEAGVESTFWDEDAFKVVSL